MVIAAGVIAVLNGAVGLAVGGAVVALGLITAAPVAFGAGVAGLLISPEIDPVLHTIGALAPSQSSWTPRWELPQVVERLWRQPGSVS